MTNPTDLDALREEAQAAQKAIRQFTGNDEVNSKVCNIDGLHNTLMLADEVLQRTLSAMPVWQPVSEKPDEYGSYLVKLDDGFIQLAHYAEEIEWVEQWGDNPLKIVEWTIVPGSSTPPAPTDN